MLRTDHRFIALDVDIDVRWHHPCDFMNSVCPRDMTTRRHYDLHPVSCAVLVHLLRIGGDDQIFEKLALSRARKHMMQHRVTADRTKNLPRKPRRIEPRWDDPENH